MNAGEIREIAAQFKEACANPFAAKTDIALSAATANAWAQMEIAAQLAELNEKLASLSGVWRADEKFLRVCVE